MAEDTDIQDTTFDNTTSLTSSIGYYYHPLGSLAEAFTDNSTNEIDFPYTVDEIGDEKTPLGISKLNWGKGNSIPEGSAVYSMTNGTIYNVIANKNKGNEGFSVYVKTDKVDGDGKAICILYKKLGGVSDKIANVLGCTSGALSSDEFSKIVIDFSNSISIEMGEEIGYVNSWSTDGSKFQTDFVYEGNEENNDTGTDIGQYETTSPHIKGEQINKKFSLESIDEEKNKYIVKCDGKTIGTEDGMVKLQNGKSSKYYPVYPFVSYLVCQQTPVYIESSSNAGPDGGIPMLNKSEIVCVDKMNSQAVDFYLTGVMSDRWLGTYPTNIQEVNNQKGIRYAVAICKQELYIDPAKTGLFPEISYAKLIRAKMISDLRGDTAEEWFYRIPDGQFDEKPTWLAKTFSEEDLLYAQLVYKNLKYPNLYGEETFTGTPEYKKAIITGCQQVPIFNNAHYHSFGPLAYIVNFNVYSNQELGDEKNGNGGGNFLMYRCREGNMTKFNKRIQE